MPRSSNSSVDETLNSRFDRIEREMVREGSLEMAALRRLLHGLSDAKADTDPITKVDAIVKRIGRLETETQRLRAQLRAQRNQQKGTKKERAKRLARNEVLRQIDRGTNPIGEGGAVDVPKVIDMGHGLGVEFTHKTVGDAFDALAAEWDCFEHRNGSGTKTGANKQLIAAGSAVPGALWQIYEDEFGLTVDESSTFAESSNTLREER